MKQCSLFGNKFHHHHILEFIKKNQYQVNELLKKALQEEFIAQVLTSEREDNGLSYQFSHDRIQQVFYGLINQQIRHSYTLI